MGDTNNVNNAVVGKKVNRIKFLNQGTYGCIYHPGINCKGKKENIKYVSKIQANKERIKNELFISENIRKIKGYIRYFAPIIKDCFVKIARPFQAEIEKCKPLNIQSPADFDNKFVITKLRYLGQTDLESYIKNIFVDKSANQAMSLFKKAHSFLLKGIHKLNDAGIIHFDIKSNNIMFDKKANNPVFIDFGLSFMIDDLYKYRNGKDEGGAGQEDAGSVDGASSWASTTEMSSETNKRTIEKIFFASESYSYWCIDVHIICFVIKHRIEDNIVDENTINNIFSVFGFGNENREIKNGIFLSYFVEDQDLELFENKYIEFMQQFIGNPWRDVVYYFIDNSTYKTWDSYAVDVTMMLELSELIKKGLDISNIENDIQYYKSRVQETIYSMPNERKFVDTFQ